MARRRLLSGLCLLAGLAFAGYAKYHGARVHGTGPDGIARILHRLPPLPLVDDAGGPVDLAEAAMGRRSVIVFYSGTCSSCQEVLPELLPFPPSLRLMLVDEGEGEAPDNLVTAGFEGALQLRDPHRVLLRSFPMSGMPTILFLDERGILREALVGTRARGLLRRKLITFAGEGD